MGFAVTQITGNTCLKVLHTSKWMINTNDCMHNGIYLNLVGFWYSPFSHKVLILSEVKLEDSEGSKHFYLTMISLALMLMQPFMVVPPNSWLILPVCLNTKLSTKSNGIVYNNRYLCNIPTTLHEKRSIYTRIQVLICTLSCIIKSRAIQYNFI
jgi:hypothetical protein